MFFLTPYERKVLIFTGILILGGATLRFLNIGVREPFPTTSLPLVVNINKASQEELEKLPGIGAKIAQDILEYRTQYQEFRTLDDLRRVKGIGKKKLELIRPFITFE